LIAAAAAAAAGSDVHFRPREDRYFFGASSTLIASASV
jgi:hypothetical protein